MTGDNPAATAEKVNNLTSLLDPATSTQNQQRRLQGGISNDGDGLSPYDRFIQYTGTNFMKLYPYLMTIL